MLNRPPAYGRRRRTRGPTCGQGSRGTMRSRPGRYRGVRRSCRRAPAEPGGAASRRSADLRPRQEPACSPRSSSPTAERSPSGPSAPAYELGIRTVAVFPWEDRNAVHRIKADEAYLIGERGHPVRAYLDVAEIIRVARESGADAVYPGYGFLSENPELAQACEAHGITFVGPPPRVLAMAGNKVRAVAAAREAGRAGAAVVGAVGGRRRARGRRATRSASRCSPRPSRAAAAGACAGSTTAEQLRDGARDGDARGRGRVRRRHAVPRAGRAAAAPHRGPGARRRRPARPSTCSSGTARCSAATRRSSRSRRRRPSTPRSATRSAATPWPSPGRSATSTPARSSSSSTPRARTPASTSSSR